MKRLIIFCLFCILSACGETSVDGGFLSSLTSANTNSSVRQKMQTCMLNEAQNKLQAGTLFTQGLSKTADELVSICAKKLALQAAGIDSEAHSTAENIITNLKNMAQ